MRKLPKIKRTPGQRTMGEIMADKKPPELDCVKNAERYKNMKQTGDCVRDSFAYLTNAPEELQKYKNFVNSNASKWIQACVQQDEEKFFNEFEALCIHTGWDLHAANLIMMHVIGVMDAAESMNDIDFQSYCVTLLGKYVNTKQSYIIQQLKALQKSL